jgi:methyl-accepting chemotaxis protein
MIVLGLLSSVMPAEAASSSGWGTAQLIEHDDTSHAFNPQVAVDRSGNATAVWQQANGAVWNICSNRYVVGSGWGEVQLLETDNSGDAFYPQVATDGRSSAVTVWYQSDGVRNNVWANRYVTGIGWYGAQLIETDNSGNAMYPQVVVDSSGNATAVWHQSDGVRENIWANRYVVGSGWGVAQLIETDNTGAALYPQVAVDGSGNVTAVWYQSDGFRYNILANRFVVGSGWGIAQLIETDNSGNAMYPQVAIDGLGNAIVVWLQYDGARYNVCSNRYVRGSGWGIAQLIETDNSGSAMYPQVAADGQGNAVAVWNQNDGVRDNIWANRYVVGSGWGVARLMETNNLGPAYDPQVATDNQGNAIACWSQHDGLRYDITANRYAVGSGWGVPQIIEVISSGDARYPQVATDDQGNAIAVWQQVDGIRTNIYSNRYIAPDITPPSLALSNPTDGMTTDTLLVTVSGTTEPGVFLSVNGILAAVENNGSFSCKIALEEGSNTIVVTATDSSGNSATLSRSVIYHNPLLDLIAELRSQLNITNQALSNATDDLGNLRNQLNMTDQVLDNATDDLVDLTDRLNTVSQALGNVTSDLANLRDQLNATNEDLSNATAKLADLNEQLNATNQALDDATNGLEDLRNELSTTNQNLGNATVELQELRDQLNSTKNDLSSTSDTLNGVKSQQNLILIVLVIVAILAVLMSVMYFGLSRKMSRMGIKPVEEDTLPPKT